MKREFWEKHDLEAYATAVNMAITITLLQLKSKYYFNTTGFNASEKHGLEQKNMWRDRVARLHLTMEGISAQKKK